MPQTRRPLQANLTVNPPGDRYEQEADRVANAVIRMPFSPGPLGRTGSLPGHTPAIHRLPGISRVQTSSGGAFNAPPHVEAQIRQMEGSGQALPQQEQTFFKERMGYDFGQVRVHTGASAAQTSRELSARAFTSGSNIAFGAGAYQPGTDDGRRLLAHELTHVVQQGGAGQRVQRYEAGEHARLGETQKELKAAFAPTSYTVQKGDKLSAIAKDFGIAVADLKNANKAKLKKWPASDGSGRLIEGFNAGETVSIPKKLNEFAKSATKEKAAKVTINGVVLDYGVAMALGDLFESPEQMAKASPKELKDLAALVKREQSGGKPVTTKEWQKASGGRYLKLAEKNFPHFAPPSKSLVTPSPAGATSPNNKSEWENHHAAALDASRSGDKDKALRTNAFADHFLTDAFATGHLANKRDLMEKFKSQLKLDPKTQEFTEPAQNFFNAVAKDAFTGAVKTQFSKYETYEAYKLGWHPNIDSVSTFSTLLQRVHKEEPDLVANAVAKAVHDKFNAIPGGLPVENDKGDNWRLSGEGKLNAKTMEIAQKAVAQSQLNVISVYNLVGPLDYAALYEKVWSYTPKPSPAGIKQVVAEVKKGTSIKSADLKKAVVKLIKDNYNLMIDELVKRKKLRKA